MNVSTVKSWSAEKGWGFLLNPEPGGPDIFVHHTGVLGHGRKDLEPGLQVTFSLEQTDKGLRAVNVAQGTARPTRIGGASVLASLLLLFHFAFSIWNCPAADSITITGYALFQNGTPVSRQFVTLSPAGPLPRTYYTNQYTPQAFSCQTTTNGFYGFTNVLWGYYTFTIPGNPGRSFPVTVGTNLSGVVNMSVVITNTATLPPNPSTNYYTQAQVDALIAGLDTGGGGGSDPNAITNYHTAAVTLTNTGNAFVGTFTGTASNTTNLLASGIYTGMNKSTTGRTVWDFANISLSQAGALFAGDDLSAGGDVIAAGQFIGDGSGLTNLSAGIPTSNGKGTNTTLYTSTDAPEHTFLTTPSGNYQLRVSDIDFGWYFTGGVSADGFYGDGSGLTGLDINNFGTGSRITLTNMIADWDSRWWFEPHDHNLSLTNLQQRYRTGKTLRIANYGDNAFDPYTLGAVPNVLAQFLSNVGTIGGSGGLYYSDTSPTVTQNSGFGYGTIPFILYGMPNNTGITNRTAFYCDTVTLQYVRSNGFGTITVMTNDGSSGAWGVVAVVDANNGGTIAGGVTNFTIAAGTRKAAAWSSGTNVIQYCGNYWSSNPTNFVWDPFQAGTIDILTAATNSAWLDCTTKWLSQYDVVIFNESSQSNQAILGYVPFAASMRTNAPTTDLIFLQPPPITNAVDLSLASRLAYGKLGADYGLPIMDLGSQFFPLNPTKLSRYYNSDGVHLSLAGNRLVGWRLANFLLQPFVRPEALNASLLTSGTIPMGRVSSGTNEYAGPMLTQSNGVARYWSFNGGGLTNLNADELRTGTIPDARYGSDIQLTNASGSAFIGLSSQSGGYATITWNGNWGFGVGGITASSFAGSGAGLTGIPYQAVNGLAFVTNPATGHYTNANGGGVSVGATSLRITNGNAFANLMAVDANPRLMIGQSGGMAITATTNRIAGTNGSGFFVLDAGGNQTNSGVLNNVGKIYVGAGNNQIGNQAARQFDIMGFASIISISGGASTAYAIEPGGTIAGSGNAVGISMRTGAGGGVTINRINAGTVSTLTNLFAWDALFNSTTATNGYFLPTNGIPANPIAGRFYSTNGASAITFGAFASVPTDSLTRTTITVSNTTAATPFQVIFPGGTRATNGVPATFDVQGSTEAIFEVYHNAQRSTNVVRVF